MQTISLETAAQVCHNGHFASVIDQIANGVWEILDLRTFRKSAAHELDGPTVAQYTRQISHWVQRGEPIGLTMIAFPFKIPNPLKTRRRRPDLGELAFLTQMLRLHDVVRTRYTPGVRWTILTEGDAYRRFVGVAQEDADVYAAGIREFIRFLQAEGQVQLVSLRDVVESHPRFHDVYAEQHATLEAMFPDAERHQACETSFRTFSCSVNVRDEDPALLGWMYSEQNDSALFENADARRILERAREATIAYDAYQRTKNLLECIPERFSHHLYVSITAKPGRYAFHPIHQRTRHFPHHGVAVRMPDRVNIQWRRDVEGCGKLEPVYLDGDEGEPFYYRQA